MSKVANEWLTRICLRCKYDTVDIPYGPDVVPAGSRTCKGWLAVEEPERNPSLRSC